MLAPAALVAIGRRWSLLLFAGYMLLAARLLAVRGRRGRGRGRDRQPRTRSPQRSSGAADGMTTLHVDDDEAARGGPGLPDRRLDQGRRDAPAQARRSPSPSGCRWRSSRSSGEPTAGLRRRPAAARARASSGEGLPALDVAEAKGAQLDAEGDGPGRDRRRRPRGAARGASTASTWDAERGGVVVELEGAPELRFGDGERRRGEVAGAGRGAAGSRARRRLLRRRQRPRTPGHRRLSAALGSRTRSLQPVLHPSRRRNRPRRGRRSRAGGYPKIAWFAGLFCTLKAASTSSCTRGSPRDNSQARLESSGMGRR